VGETEKTFNEMRITKGVILHYKEGQWSVYNVPEAPEDLAWQLHSVHFPFADEGWAVGFTASTPLGSFHYEDDWWSLFVMPKYEFFYFLNSVHFPSTDEGWAVGMYRLYTEKFLAIVISNVSYLEKSYSYLRK